MGTEKDFSPSGLKLEGQYENDRNGESSAVIKMIVREAYGVQDVIVGHHIVYEVRDKRPDGFTYDVVQEIPSADALIFDHAVARRIWGEANYKDVLTKLAHEPCETRNKLLAKLYGERPCGVQSSSASVAASA